MTALGLRMNDRWNPKAHGLPSVGFCARAWWCALLILCACASSPPVARTTFLNSVDLVEMTDRMAQSFAAHEAIANRTPHSAPWVISMNRIENHTNPIIPDREKWLYVARLRALLDRSDLAREASIIWIIPPERWAPLQDELGPEPPVLRLPPTHQLTGEFTALTNTSGRGRSDMYLAAYQLFELQTGRLIWEDRWEVKRAVEGRTYD